MHFPHLYQAPIGDCDTPCQRQRKEYIYKANTATLIKKKLKVPCLTISRRIFDKLPRFDVLPSATVTTQRRDASLHPSSWKQKYTHTHTRTFAHRRVHRVRAHSTQQSKLGNKQKKSYKKCSIDYAHKIWHTLL